MNADALAVSGGSNLFRPLQAIDFLTPPILLAGVVGHMMYAFFEIVS